MRKNRLIILFLFAILILTQQDSFSQIAAKRIKQDSYHKLPGIKIDRGTEAKKIKLNKEHKGSKMSGVSYFLNEDFESGNFPPVGWTATPGTQMWDMAYVSGMGIGNYSAFYSSWNCNYSNNTLYSPNFGPTLSGNQLYFDYAYAPWDDGTNVYYDDMEIFYSDDNGTSWYSLQYLSGYDLQTSPSTGNYFVPESYEWGTYYIELPAGTTNIYYKVYENCSNNIYIDNIKIEGPPLTDVAVTAAYSKGRFPITFLTNDTISANLRNVGNQGAYNLKVYMQMTGANNHFDSAVVPYIAGSQNYVVTFNPYTPVINGNSSIKIWITGGDADIYNDTAYCVTNVNSNYFAYADTIQSNYNGTIGFFDHVSILQKFRVTNANSRITEVKLKIPGGEYGNSPVGQGIRGIILDENKNIVARSDEYKIKASDLGNFVTFKLTNPRPYYPLTNDSYFYAGGDFDDPVGDEYFWNLANQSEDPPRPDCFFLGLGPSYLDIGGYVYTVEFGNKFGIEAKIENMPSVDVGISSMGNLYDQYYSATSAPMTGKVFNNALSGTASATVIRKITPGSYTSSVPVSIPANSTVSVTFANFTFTSGTAYTVRDSVILAGDINTSNNSMSREYTPRIAKDLVVIYQKDEDKDSLVRSILADGRYVNKYDVINLNYKGSYRPWKIIFNCTKSGRRILEAQRDSLKAFLDASTAGNKKSLIVFNDNPANFENEYSNPADSIFLRQYLRAQFVSNDWLAAIPSSGKKFKGKGFFSGVSQDSVTEPLSSTAQLIKPTNGSSAAFVPKSITGSGSDSAIAVSYAGTNYNTFFMSSRFSDLRATNSSPLDGPVLVYTKIIDWLQNISSGVKVLDITVLLEGVYDQNANSMKRDTIKVYLRNATSPFSRVDSAKVYLGPSGMASALFNNAANGVNYYIQVKHRNSMETWSKLPQMFSSNHLTYDFTTAANKAYGDNMKQMGSRWALYSGDVTDYGAIDATDLSDVDNDSYNSLSGYVVTDLTGDDFVDASDVSVCDNNVTIGVYRSAPAPSVYAGSPEDNLQSINISGESEFKIDHEIYERTKNMIRVPDPNFKREIKFTERKNNRVEYKTLK